MDAWAPSLGNLVQRIFLDLDLVWNFCILWLSNLQIKPRQNPPIATAQCTAPGSVCLVVPQIRDPKGKWLIIKMAMKLVCALYQVPFLLYFISSSSKNGHFTLPVFGIKTLRFPKRLLVSRHIRAISPVIWALWLILLTKDSGRVMAPYLSVLFYITHSEVPFCITHSPLSVLLISSGNSFSWENKTKLS